MVGYKSVYCQYIKRSIDVVLALIGIICSSPIMLITALLIKIDSPGDVIFRQLRLGYGGKEFIMYKFRSMCVNAEADGVYEKKGDARVTRIGKIIRARSVDELPQLINVLKGDMSIIGFRPPLTYHPWPIDEYTDSQLPMFNVRPGITGWAQVHGRKNVEWNERINLNVWYSENVSMLVDLKILFMTVFKVISNADNKNNGETAAKKIDESVAK